MVVNGWVGSIDPSKSNNVEFGAPFIDADEAVVLMKSGLDGVFDLVECGCGQDCVCDAYSAML